MSSTVRRAERCELTLAIATIVAVGELLVEFVSHQKGCGLEKISQYTGPYPSGAPAIFLDQAALWGAKTMMFGGVGNDGFGRSLVARLKRDGVGTAGVVVHPTLATGTAFVSYYENGSRDFIFHLKNTAADDFLFSPSLLPAGDLILHVSGSSLGSPRMRTQIMAAVNAVLARGGRISCDPNARSEIMKEEESRAALESVVARSFCLMPSTSDLDFLFPGMTEAAATDRLLETTAEIVVVKRGSRGATVFSKRTRYDIAPHPVHEVDPTGAGDGFCGVFLSLVAQGRSPEEAATWANAAGAISVTRRGPMEGNTAPEEVQQFMTAHASAETSM
jgi:sugar/nucleoside kinase (ribokinase family)